MSGNKDKQLFKLRREVMTLRAQLNDISQVVAESIDHLRNTTRIAVVAIGRTLTDEQFSAWVDKHFPEEAREVVKAWREEAQAELEGTDVADTDSGTQTSLTSTESQSH